MTILVNISNYKIDKTENWGKQVRWMSQVTETRKSVSKPAGNRGVRAGKETEI